METLIIDTRQKKGKHQLKHDFFKSLDDIEIIEHALNVGDYMMVGCPYSFDTKANIQELAQDIQGKDHDRFRRELIRAQEAGIKLVILVETKHVSTLDELAKWREPNDEYYRRGGRKCPNAYKSNCKRKPKGTPRRIYGKPLAKACETMEKKYGCEFVFCEPEKSGCLIIDVLMTDPFDPAFTFERITAPKTKETDEEPQNVQEAKQDPKIEEPFAELLNTVFTQ